MVNIDDWKNEKYITYTRALDELYVYDQEIELRIVRSEIQTIEISNNKKSKENGRKKREKRSSKEIKDTINTGIYKGLEEFFEDKGLKVVDDRNKSGHLWVIGSKKEISPIINEAMEIYGITGIYGSGKISGFKEGWFTKSKK